MLVIQSAWLESETRFDSASIYNNKGTFRLPKGYMKSVETAFPRMKSISFEEEMDLQNVIFHFQQGDRFPAN